MGAHTLGKCMAVNSGIEGSWVGTSLSFSTDYFKKLLFIGWGRNLAQSAVAQSPDVWTNGPQGRTVMLRTDVELLFNTTNTQGTDACDRFNGIGTGSNAPVPAGRCPFQNTTINAITAFAAPGGSALFYPTFSNAWNKMVNVRVWWIHRVGPILGLS